ncbi:23S rRNA (adenine(2503)-C(2))-methyltransferase RlmN [bacterium]|nr:23S rRNA (adenine(2503)-C(2))-methyltransferase RlmN [bacterium]
MNQLLGIPPAKLKESMKDNGIKPFVADQILDWVFKKSVLNFSDMQNVSKENREKLSTLYNLFPFKDVEVLESSDGLAVKGVLTLEDGAKIESVILKERDYYNLCISTQCGCPVDCKFCLTGITGFKRNLKAAEIVGQILWANNYLASKKIDSRISHLVFMGMGEPLLNYDELIKALAMIHDEQGFYISTRKVTVSTSGFIKTIRKLIEDDVKLNLAFSVGCVNRDKRIEIMPVEELNPIMDVAKVLKEYQALHNRKLTLEYTMLSGVNDTDQDIQDLIGLAKYLKAKINLINLNPHNKIPFKEISNTKLHRLKTMIQNQHVPVTIRFRKGRDISAACGQLGESRMEATNENGDD